jgi:hypothetical protein
MSESVETVCKVLGTEVVSDGRTVRWLELPSGDHPFSVPVNLIPDELEEGDYVALKAIASDEESFGG